MVEATAQTTTSTFSIWVIVVVATVALAFWLTAIMLADRSQVRASGPKPDGAWAYRSVPGEEAAEVADTAAREPVAVPGQVARDEPVPGGEAPTRADLPAQPAAGQPTLPAQRPGDADRAARSHAGQAGPDNEMPLR
jgi:hypothetical protein